MAWIKNNSGGGRWVARKERGDIIASLRAFSDDVIARLNAGEYVPDEEVVEWDGVQTELERLERIHRCETDTLEFAIEYFGEARNPSNAGNWDGFDITDKSESADFHVEITDIMNDVSAVNKNAKIALASPRSHSKSTYLSKNFPVHQIVYRLRKYVIIISETPSVSGPNLEWIAMQLKHNEKLRADFGALLSERQQENVRDNSAEFVTWEKRGDSKRQLTKVEAASTGQALRGRNWNGTRPDLIICDDLEDAKTNAATEEQRQKLKAWFESVVIPLGDPKGEKTAILYLGTTVHFSSLLMNILYRRSDFKTKVYRAIIKYPDRMDLWEQCRKLYQEHENKDRLENAKKFYEAHFEDMNKGAEVLWPEFQSVWKLMAWKWDNGSKAFNTEYMNNPIDEESMIFNPANFAYWSKVDALRKFPHSEYTISMGLDFGMGKQKGDYSAVITVAKHKQTGVVYVIDAWGERVHPDKFLELAVEKVIQFEPDVIGVESQMAQEWFADKLREELDNRGFPGRARVKKIYQRSRKEIRIEAMLPDVESGKIQFHDRHLLLIEQLERYGQGGHDDLPDAMEISIRVSAQAKRPIRQKPSWA
ncbi:phage terminase large subunit [Sporosarcina koreensis]|uniref:phage terminase large subunit n=1 Tax=Sporosarcina koreensis TaxID=334735 RepID=UPI000AEE70CF|nr:phage terminase large subunit [Sporosarcina koreensis]